MSRRARFIVWGTVIGFAILVAIPFVISFSVKLRWRYQIDNALRSADTVRIEEFERDKILSHLELDEAQRAELADILPTILPVGVPFSVKLCFVPHHRIVARTSEGIEFVVTVCFECEQARQNDSVVYDMAPWGAKALRSFLESNGVAIRKPEDYIGIAVPK